MAEVLEMDLEVEGPLRASPVSIVRAGGKLFKWQPSVSRAILTLTREKLVCRDEQPETGPQVVREFLLEDLVGVDVSRLPPAYNTAACQINVHVYPKMGKKNSRKLTTLSVSFDEKETHGENESEASKWKEEIKLYSYRRCRQVLHSVDSTGKMYLHSWLRLMSHFCTLYMYIHRHRHYFRGSTKTLASAYQSCVRAGEGRAGVSRACAATL